MNLQSAILTHPGQRRPNNEDFVALFEPTDEETLQKSGCLYIVADGVGGASNGELASRYAVQKILYDYYQYQDIPVENRLKTIILQAGNDIFDFAENQDNYMQMATTVVVAVVREGTVQVAHVGDSRAYLLHDGEVIQLTRDHTTVGELMRDGVLNEDEAMRFEGRNPLSRSLGGERDVVVDVSEPIAFESGDKILLSSDGFTRYATRADILDFLSQGPAKEVAGQMIDFANQSGGVDNISVIIIEADGVVSGMPVVAGVGGDLLEPVDWDTIHTLPSNYVDAKRRRKAPSKRQYVFYGVGALVVVVVGLLTALFVINRFFKIDDSVDETATAQQSMVQTGVALVQTGTAVFNAQEAQPSPTETVTPTQTPSEAVSNMPSLTPELILGGEPTTTGTVTEDVTTPSPAPTQTRWPTKTMTLTQTRQPSPTAEVGSCTYTVNIEEYTWANPHNLPDLLDNYFNKQFASNEDFQAYALEIISLRGYDYTEYWFIGDGYQMILPEIARQDCVVHGGEFEGDGLD